MVLSGIVPFQSISVNTGLFDNCQLLCVFEVRSLLPVTLSEYCAELFCTKRCPVFRAKTGKKRAPAGSVRSSRSDFSLKLQGKWGFWPHKRDKCRICLVDKFGIYHVLVRLFFSFLRRHKSLDFPAFYINSSKPSTRKVSRLLSSDTHLWYHRQGGDFYVRLWSEGHPDR